MKGADNRPGEGSIRDTGHRNRIIIAREPELGIIRALKIDGYGTRVGRAIRLISIDARDYRCIVGVNDKIDLGIGKTRRIAQTGNKEVSIRGIHIEEVIKRSILPVHNGGHSHRSGRRRRTRRMRDWYISFYTRGEKKCKNERKREYVFHKIRVYGVEITYFTPRKLYSFPVVV